MKRDSDLHQTTDEERDDDRREARGPRVQIAHKRAVTAEQDAPKDPPAHG